MIIKFAKDAKDGACEYLANGTKGDRDKKDIRVKLVDWDCNNSIEAVNEYLKKTKKWDDYKDNYKHIVLSFNNDNLDEETLKNIVNDFVKLYMHAYSDEEYTYYAEAHIPKLKHNKNGEKRHLHIHIFIHKYSLLLDRRLRFFTHPQRRQELNLIKHFLIKKYNLNYTFTNKAISKSKIDYLSGSTITSAKQLKSEIESYIEANIQNFSNFDDMLRDIEKTFDVEIKTSKNAKTPYISISHKNFKRNVRLKELLFGAETFDEARESILNNIELKKYEKEYFLSIDEILQELEKKQRLLKEEVGRKLKKARAYAQKKKLEAELNLAKGQLNKIMFKLNILNEALDIRLDLLREFANIAVFNDRDEVKLIGKEEGININVTKDKDKFVAGAIGQNKKQEAKILAQIVSEKVKNGELRREDIVVDGDLEFKFYFSRFLRQEINQEKNMNPQKQIEQQIQNENHINKVKQKNIDF